ncbi:HDOD domain-containing protein [Shewanella canadensis]|uniref:HDOD domain-containing protein n=1 Tax=Shewanella canadensis TaxID=271096 RepID=A0A3S0LJE7_9GAMM|nr:HDOD domain-containing protein [Shewanella canadensis]RTR36906.1 HDOD domain-containing protein [Shewanella canadensis]
MVIKLLQKIFNIRDNAVVSQPKSFTLNPELQQISSTKPKASLEPLSSVTDSVDVSALFYSLLFPVREKDQGGVANNLEKNVIGDVERALSSPMAIAENVLKLPTRMAELDKKLGDESADIKVLLELMQKDPVLSVEVLKLCNSPVFKRSEREVTSLQQAFVQLGRDQLRRFVTTSLVREMIEIKPIYYRRFGLQIWRHSMQVAFLSSELSNEDPDTAFMLGLLHDVGKIAIFKMLLDGFNLADPGELPCSSLFRQVMTSKSLSLSALLARCWQLPASFETSLNALANTSAKPTERLAVVVWQANLISECSMLHQAGKLDEVCLNRLIIDADLTREEFDLFHEKLKTF